MPLTAARLQIGLPGRRTTATLYWDGRAYRISLPNFRDPTAPRIFFVGAPLPPGGVAFSSKVHADSFTLSRRATGGIYRADGASFPFVSKKIEPFAAVAPSNGAYFRVHLRDGTMLIANAPDRARAQAWAEARWGADLFLVEGARYEDIRFFTDAGNTITRTDE